MGSPPGPETIIDGKPYLYFAGTAYLGLQGDPRVIEAGCEAMRKYGVHTATSRGGFGDNPATLEVERLAAKFFGTEDAFYFATGYAGPAILTAGAEPFDAILLDRQAHYASQEAANLSVKPGGTIDHFKHSDVDDLARVMGQYLPRQPRVLVMCDGVSPVLGDIAPVAQYQEVFRRQDGPVALSVDDAHGVGVLGADGRGCVELANEKGDIPFALNDDSKVEIRQSLFMCATLSKAFGGYGGIIPGSAEAIARMKAESRWYNGASAPPAGAAGATAKALEIVLAEPQLRHQLHANVRYLKARLRKVGLAVNDTPVPIIPLELGDAANMRRIQDALKDRGVIIAYIEHYSGVGPEGCLRIAVFANHTQAMLDRLIDGLAAVI
ncbi:MAG: pyridoxal phosphate-dependent aminotransferase family protein [Phycisphaeraceae bacterium]